MTTSTLETVSGLVERINATGTGVKVPGQWLNISQYHALAELPKLGQRVEVQVQRTYGQSEQRGKQQPVQSKAKRRAKGKPTRAEVLARLNELTELARRGRLR